MCILDNFMEDYAFHQQQRAEYEFRMWEQFIEEKEAEEKAYDTMAEQHFKDLERYETLTMEREYRRLEEWEDLQTI